MPFPHLAWFFSEQASYRCVRAGAPVSRPANEGVTMATPSINVGSKTREVVRKIRGQPTSDGAGVRLTRVIGTGALDSFDPFLLLDEFRSDDPNDYLAGFPNHPRSEERRVGKECRYGRTAAH